MPLWWESTTPRTKLTVVAVLALGVLIFCYYWRIQKIFNASALSFYTPDSFPVGDQTAYHRLVASGHQLAKTKRLVIASMVRDVEHRIPTIIKKVERLGGLFADYVVLIVENDSKDRTRELLLAWADRNPRVKILGCHAIAAPLAASTLQRKVDAAGPSVAMQRSVAGGEVRPATKCTIPASPKTDGHHVDRPRIEKMVRLRNIYLDEIKRKYMDWDYAAFWDLDSISTVYLDGVEHTIGWLDEHPDYGVVCAYGIYRWGMLTLFYDTYALLNVGEEFHIDQKLWHDLKKGIDGRRSRGDEPYEVDSCFSGFAIYRISDLEGKSYRLPTERLECEHVTLNKTISARKAVNPSMINLLLLND